MSDLQKQIDSRPHADWLHLTLGKIKDLSPIARVKTIDKVVLWGSPKDFPDLSPLADLPHLKILTFEAKDTVDLSAFSKCEQLEEISLFETEDSFDTLAKIPHLKKLNLRSKAKPLPSLAGLAQLESLVELHIERGIERLRGVALKATELECVTPQKFDLSALSHLTHLQRLVIGDGYSQIESLKPLSGLINLRTFSLVSGRVSDLKALRNMEHLESVWMASNKNLTSIEGLQNKPALKVVGLNHCPVASLEPLRDCAALEEVRVRGCKAKDFTPLFAKPHLKVLYAEKTKLASLADLNLPALETLWIFGTKVKDLSPLSACPNLKELNISSQRIEKGAEVLLALKQLDKLDVYLAEVDETVLKQLNWIEEIRGFDAEEDEEEELDQDKLPAEVIERWDIFQTILEIEGEGDFEDSSLTCTVKAARDRVQVEATQGGATLGFSLHGIDWVKLVELVDECRDQLFALDHIAFARRVLDAGATVVMTTTQGDRIKPEVLRNGELCWMPA